MSSYIVVHPSGMDPFLSHVPAQFLDSREVWGDDRDLAVHFLSKHEAEKRAEERKKSFGDRRVVIDEVDHPEIESALARCFRGDMAALSIVEEYGRQYGTVSLKYFASRALFGKAGDRRLIAGCFDKVFRDWLATAEAK